MNDNDSAGANDNTNASGGEKNHALSWKDQLGDLANHDRVKNLGSIRAMAEALVSTPTPPTLPETSDGYTLPEKIKVKGLRKMAHENQLTQKQLDGILSFNEGVTKSALEEASKKKADAVATLKSEWGDDYENNLNKAKQTLKSIDNKDREMAKLLTTTGMADDPRVAKFLHKLSGTLQEGGFVNSEGNIKKKPSSLAERMFPNHKPD